MKSRRLPLLAALAAFACRPAPHPATDSATVTSTVTSTVASSAASADSLLLERVAGFTRRPGYRVSVTRTGRVDFAWLAPGDSARPDSATIPPASAAALIDAAAAAGVGTLPENIREHPDLCGPMATDHGTAVITLFGPAGRTTRVSDYLGCRDAVPALRAYEARIDSVAGTERWTTR